MCRMDEEVPESQMMLLSIAFVFCVEVEHKKEWGLPQTAMAKSWVFVQVDMEITRLGPHKTDVFKNLEETMGIMCLSKVVDQIHGLLGDAVNGAVTRACQEQQRKIEMNLVQGNILIYWTSSFHGYHLQRMMVVFPGKWPTKTCQNAVLEFFEGHPGLMSFEIEVLAGGITLPFLMTYWPNVFLDVNEKLKFSYLYFIHWFCQFTKHGLDLTSYPVCYLLKTQKLHDLVVDELCSLHV
ncbi:hypothetical protein STAS_30431 [Striga asiatica]|uniref:Uncharacterized protein n=1 Tax=Striga asiatica TaxID=4170 RepID=A0A5A7R687_STRAF|nr:hypothetical protein STAS_30431 [Striga asiatica]